MEASDFIETGAGLLEIKIVVHLQGAKGGKRDVF